MKKQHADILHQCVTGAFAGTMTFLETVQRMAPIGVRWYSANLLLGIKTHYFDDSAIHQEKWPEWTPLPGHRPFNLEAVVAAIRAIQCKDIIYPEFLRRIGEAGIVVYTVHLQSRKAIYFSEDGDFHVEHFPKPA